MSTSFPWAGEVRLRFRENLSPFTLLVASTPSSER